jgi:Flp pilus assembly protein TadG
MTMKAIRSLVRNERGNSFVEMALVAPFLTTLLVGVVDLSRAYSAKLQLVQASQRTIEQVMQQAAIATDYSAALKAEGAAAAGVNETAVTPDYWLECSTDGTTWVRDPGGFNDACETTELYYARYVTVDIAKSYKPLFSSRYFPGSDSQGNYTLHGKAGVRVQ